MEAARAEHKIQILITNVGSFLGSEVAKSLLATNCTIFGIGSTRLSHSILKNRDFTLLEIDLAQPLPAYLPDFDIIFDLSLLSNSGSDIGDLPRISPQTINIISLAAKNQAKVFIFAPVATSHEFYDYLTARQPSLKENLTLFLIGDLYGPGMPISGENLLTSLIKQASLEDKIILENEGLEHIYPAYITDVIFALNKFTFGQERQKIHYLVSEDAKTSLSVAYEIQNAVRIIANKEVGLFFAGKVPRAYSEPEVKVAAHELGFSPKVDLREGLKKTIEDLVSKDLIRQPAAKTFPPHELEHQKSAPSPSEPQSRLPRIPLSFPSLAPKKIILLVAVLLLLTLLKTALDLFLGVKNLADTQKSLNNGDFKTAYAKARNSQKSFQAAANKIRILSYPLTFVIKGQIKSLHNTLEATTAGTSALTYFIEGAEVLARDFAIITSSDVKNDGFDLELPQASFKKAHRQSSQALYLLEKGKAPFSETKLLNAKAGLRRLQTISLRGYELANLTADFTGQGDKKTYLVLLQNNTELRPGGGFIGNFAQINFEEGKLKDITVEDIYTIDGQLKEKIEPPAQIKEKLSIDNLYLRDSNWSGDFEINAATARDLFKKETGKDIDGIIAIDLTLVQDILAKIGPIALVDYNEQISAENLFERGEYYSEVGFFPGSTQKRDFFGALTRALVAKILEGAKTSGQKDAGTLPWLALVEASAESLPQKHLMLTFDNPTLAAFIRTKGWNHPLPPLYFDPAQDIGETRDFVAIVEANLGANKVNRFLDRKIFYEMTIGRDADLVASLKITYTNNSQAETWPAGRYVNYLRVYVPFAAGLLAHQNGDSTKLEDVETLTQANLTIFSTYVEVPVKSQKEVSFTYRIPKNIKLEDAPTYSLYFQKQAGTGKDLLEFKFNLPAYIEIAKANGDESYTGQQNLTMSSDLAIDRQFTLDLRKR